jgi:prepilin-type N-terminal cleavage/methylation domain-containing protein
MNGNCDKAGFTLVELLVAFAIILAIVTMVYGSYFATSESAQVYKSRLAIYEQVRKVLDGMSQQVRCLYADTSGVTARNPTDEPKDVIRYFEGNTDAMNGEILHFVTTHGIFCGQQEANGLFDVIYRFDRRAGTLYLSQTSFINGATKRIEKRNPSTPLGMVSLSNHWRPLAENVRDVELAFFDGKQWVSEWDFKQKRKVPRAVKVSITCEDENQRQYSCSTIADVCCWNNRNSDGPSEALAAVGEQ